MAEFIDTDANSSGADGASQVCGNSVFCIGVTVGLMKARMTDRSYGTWSGCASLTPTADSERKDTTLPWR